MNYNIEEIISFVKTLDNYIVDGFFTENEVENFIASIENDKTLNFTWDTGATKLVLIPYRKDYVIKIPFNATEEYEYFTFSNDYCESEINLYNEAVNNNYEDFFLPIEYCISIKGGYPIYIQEKATPFLALSEWQREKLCSNESFKIIKESKVKRHFRKLPEAWLASCLDKLGTEEELQNFLEFLDNFNILSDLHYGNIGYYHNGSPVIFDYGGFFEN